MNRLLAVFKKEMKDSFRDRRAIMTAILPAIFGPILIGFMFHNLAKTRSDVTDSDFTVPVIGAEHAPDLINFLEDEGIKFEPFEGDPKTEIQSKNVSVILEIPSDYQEKFDRSEPASIYLMADGSLDKSRNAKRRVEGLIDRYSRSIGQMRLFVRGVNPQVARAVNLQERDFSTHSSRAGQILGSLQMFLLMAAFFGSAGVAIDTTAGERERKSLEPLLVHPLTSMQIMLGKWLTVVCFGLIATVVVVIATAQVLEMVSLKSLGVDPKLTFNMQLSILLLLIPSALFAGALQMLTSLFAKSFKEAQSYLGIMVILPMIPVLVTMLGNVKTASWMFFTPILGQQQILMNILRGESLDLMNFATVTLVTLGIALGLVALMTKLLRSERVVYGG
jgi:sodium transport system permease protein